MLWSLTPMSTINQLYHEGKFYRWRKLDYQENVVSSNKSDLVMIIGTHICSLYLVMAAGWQSHLPMPIL